MRYFFGFMVALGLIILVIFLLVSGGDKKPKTPVFNKPLDSYATTNAQVIMTIDGPIVANSLHQEVRVTVDRDNVTLEELQGYDGYVASTLHFANTENAYSAFLQALAHVGFTFGDKNPKLRDEGGRCSAGSRYVFEIKQDNTNIERYWTTSCGGLKTYLGAFEQTTTLFKEQVPKYDELTAQDNL